MCNSVEGLIANCCLYHMFFSYDSHLNVVYEYEYVKSVKIKKNTSSSFFMSLLHFYAVTNGVIYIYVTLVPLNYLKSREMKIAEAN